MAHKREVPNADNLVQRYLAGVPRMELLKEANISDCLFGRLLREAGVQRRTRQQAAAVTAIKTGEARRWKPDNPTKVIEDYIGGKSEKRLSDELGVSRTAIRKFLLRNGVKPRGASEAETVKWASLKKDRTAIERQLSKAWQAAEQRDAALHEQVRLLYQTGGMSLSEVASITGAGKSNIKRLLQKDGVISGGGERRARGLQASSRSPIASVYEQPILEAVRDIGLEAVHQMAIGPCNVDIAFPEYRVAVEIERITRSRSKSLRSERIKHIFDRGWKLLVVYSPCGNPINSVGVAQQINAFLQLTRSNPAVAGEYGVIGCDAKPFTRRRFNLDGRPRISGF